MNPYYRNGPYSQMPKYRQTNGAPFYNDMMHQSPQDINRIMALINQQLSSYYNELERYRVQRVVARNIFRSVVAYVLQNENRYTGSIEQKTNALLNAY